MPSFVKRCENKAALGLAAGSAIVAASAAAIKANGRFVVAFSGGSLPKIVAPFLVEHKAKVEWDKWIVVFSDERVVADGHKDLNLVTCKSSLFDHVPLPKENIIGIDVSDGVEDVSAVAKKYEAALSKVTSGTFSVDLALLGMGPDGHTCSLFPNHALLEDVTRFIAPIADSPKPPPRRITFTLKTISVAKQVMFVTAGDSKAEVLPEAVQGKSNPAVPASLVKGADNKVYWFVDEAAAAKL